MVVGSVAHDQVISVPHRMCRHFANVGKNLIQSIVISEHEGSSKKYLFNASDVSVYLKPINASDLSEILKNMKNGASGSNFVSIKTLKYIYPVISCYLVYLFNVFLLGLECFQVVLKLQKLFLYVKAGIKMYLEIIGPFLYYQYYPDCLRN